MKKIRKEKQRENDKEELKTLNEGRKKEQK
jgi:hypothetical protein